jgi:hypothetical protein
MNPQQSNYPYMPPAPRRSPTVAIVLSLVAIVVLGIIVAVVFGYRAGTKMTAAAGLVGTQFINDLGQHNWKAARELVAPAALPVTSVKDMKDIQTYVDNHYGKLTNLGTPAWFVNNYNGVTSVQLQYPATYVNGKGAILVVLTDTSGGYKVMSWRYN